MYNRQWPMSLGGMTGLSQVSCINSYYSENKRIVPDHFKMYVRSLLKRRNIEQATSSETRSNTCTVYYYRTTIMGVLIINECYFIKFYMRVCEKYDDKSQSIMLKKKPTIN